MSIEAAPRRLIEQGDRTAALVRRAAEHAPSPERLAAVQAALAAGAPVASGIGTAAKLGLAALVVGAGAGVALWPRDEEPPPPPAVVMEEPSLPPPVVEAPPRREAPQSTLPEQLRLLEAARRAAAAGEHTAALASLAELRRRFPESPLGLEARLLGVQEHAAAGQVDAALAAVESLLSDPIAAAKKAELLRLQGDLFVRQEDCKRAADSYRRALGLGLTEAEARAAREGLRRCNKE